MSAIAENGHPEQPAEDTGRSLFAGFRSGPTIGSYFEPIPPGSPPRWEYAEHGLLGDCITLKNRDGSEYIAGTKTIKLPNTVDLTYGQISALAGDFYGTGHPISDGNNLSEQKKYFHEAYATLAEDTYLQPAEVNAITKLLDKEVQAIKKACEKDKDGSPVYHNLPDISGSLELATLDRLPFGRTYLGLALINWDHFGQHGRDAYDAGHTVALEAAKDGDLEKAYALNAFADHFIQDAFSAGHVRTPRKHLHGVINVFWDLCSKLMHDEESAIGLEVSNALNHQWTMYGDKRLLDKVNLQNLAYCKDAVQASANEIYAVWKGGPVPSRDEFAVKKILPNLETVKQGQKLAPLFVLDSDGNVLRRTDLCDRTSAKYTKEWCAIKTYYDANSSGWWNYPMTLHGPGRS